jgi:uncharacterized tellurite resistance protein B-like protein
MGFLDSVTKMLASAQTGAIATQAVRSMGGSTKTAGLVGLVGKAVQGEMNQRKGGVAPAAAGTPAAAGAAASDPFAVPAVSDATARCFNRVALLNVAGWRDGSFSPGERLVLYRYIRDSADLDAEARLELMREIDKEPAEVQDFWQKAKANLSFDGLFGDQSQGQTFSSALEELVNADGTLDAAESEFVQMVRQTCGID